MSKKERRRIGDRKDGKLLRLKDVDGMHIIMPFILTNRTDNEAFISERIDITAIKEYVDTLNANNPEFKYTMFHVIVTAVIRCITLRPYMNRFISNHNLYQKDKVSAAFTIKKQFSDKAGEGLAFVHADENTNIHSVHDSIQRQVTSCRSGKNDASSDAMEILARLPRPIVRFLVAIVRMLDRHGLCPKSLIATDPFHASVVLTNLGSIKLKSGYHHLTNWGTNSVFVIVGEAKKRPVFNEDGSFEMRDTVDLGLTVDERIADGFYFSKTIRLLKKLLENPELLEQPASEPVEY